MSQWRIDTLDTSGDEITLRSKLREAARRELFLLYEVARLTMEAGDFRSQVRQLTAERDAARAACKKMKASNTAHQ